MVLTRAGVALTSAARRSKSDRLPISRPPSLVLSAVRYQGADGSAGSRGLQSVALNGRSSSPVGGGKSATLVVEQDRNQGHADTDVPNPAVRCTTMHSPVRTNCVILGLRPQ